MLSPSFHHPERVISENKFGFKQGKSTEDASFIVKQLHEKCLEKARELFHVFVDLEKAFGSMYTKEGN